MKILKKIANFFKKIFKTIDKFIITPITKGLLLLGDRYDNSGKTVEKWLSKSTTLLFISLVLAVTVFIIVDQKIITLSESSAEVLRNQPVTVTYNEEAYVVEGLPEVVDITLIGNRADLYFAKQSTSHDVSIDLTGLKPGAHRVNIKYKQDLDTIDYKVNPSVATVYIYPKISETKTLTTDILNQDHLDNKLMITGVNLESDKVIVKGADKDLEKVATVKALIDIDNLVEQKVGTSTLRDIPLKAYDDNGDVVDIEIVPAKMNADITIASPNKELPIKVIPVGELAFGKAISSITTNETKVMVYGDNDAIENLNFIPVEIDVKDLNSDNRYVQEIVKPTGIKYMTISSITIDVTIGEEVTKEFTDINIEYRNLDDDLSVQGLSQDDIKIDVVVKGVDTVLSQVEQTDITAYLDLSGYEIGEHEVTVNVEGADVKAQYVPKTKKVKVVITEK